jgi:hypothetical protein
MNPATLKMLLSALGVGSLFALVLLGKMDAIQYTDLVVAAVFGVAGHSAGKGLAGTPISATLSSTPDPVAAPAAPPVEGGPS